MYMLTVISVGIIVIVKLVIDCDELSKRTLDDYKYFNGFVLKVDTNDNIVWIAKDTSENFRLLSKKDNLLILEIRESEVFSKLKEVCNNPNHIIEIWYAQSFGKSRKNFPESRYPIIQQIVFDGEIIMSYDKNISWKGFICISIPILVLIIFCMRALIIGEQDLKNEINNEN